jgi:hydrogenase nickel incorporation protein HypA/HybF
MHELSITENILNIATRHAQQHGASRVTDLYLVIGQLSSIVDDSVQFYWDMISEDTICAGAALHFERIPAQLNCLDCLHTYTITAGLTLCPQCGGAHVQTVSGEEFRLESIEIDQAEG